MDDANYFYLVGRRSIKDQDGLKAGYENETTASESRMLVADGRPTLGKSFEAVECRFTFGQEAIAKLRAAISVIVFGLEK